MTAINARRLPPGPDPALATWVRWHLLAIGPQSPSELLAAYGKTAPAAMRWYDRDRRRARAATAIASMCNAGELVLTGLTCGGVTVPMISIGAA